MTKGRMSIEDVSKAKRLFAEGYPQRRVAGMLHISPSHMNNIVWGLVHYDVPWPNGFTGSYEDAYGDNAMPSRSKSEARLPKSRLEHKIASAKLPSGNEIDNEMVDPTKLLDAPYIPPDNKKLFEKFLTQEEELLELQRRHEDLQSHEELEGSLEPEHAVKATAWDVPFLEWEEVKKLMKDHPLVQIAEEQDVDDIMKRALGIVLKHMPHIEGDKNLAILTDQMVERLKSEPSEK